MHKSKAYRRGHKGRKTPSKFREDCSSQKHHSKCNGSSSTAEISHECRVLVPAIKVKKTMLEKKA